MEKVGLGEIICGVLDGELGFLASMFPSILFQLSSPLSNTHFLILLVTINSKSIIFIMNNAADYWSFYIEK